jgi:hypothetical protein
MARITIPQSAAAVDREAFFDMSPTGPGATKAARVAEWMPDKAADIVPKPTAVSAASANKTVRTQAQ